MMWQRLQLIVRSHWPALACAAVFAVLLSLPFVAYRFVLGPAFQGIEPEVIDDEAFYLSRIQDARDGHGTLGNAYLFEHKDKPPQQVFAAEFVLGTFADVVGLPTAQARVVTGMLLGGTLFLLFYAVAFRIGGSRSAALLAALAFFFGMYPELMLRPVSPQFNFIFWCLAAFALWRLASAGVSRSRLASASIAVGVLFYVYPYYWTWFGVLIAVMVAALWFLDRSHLRGWLAMSLLAAVIGAGYALLSFQASRLPEYGETVTRLGMIFTRFPSGFKIIAIAGTGMALIALSVWRKAVPLGRETAFWGAGLAASVIAVNQHVVTGMNLEFSSHYRTQTVAFFILVLVFLWRMSGGRRAAALRLGAAATALVVVFGTQGFADRTLDAARQSPYRQDYAPVFQWLRDHADPEAVVYADTDLSYWIPVYTSQNVFFARNAGLFLVSDRELEQRFIAQHFFEDFSPELIRKHERALVGVRYVDQAGHISQRNKLRSLLGRDPLPVPEFPGSEIDRIISVGKEIQRRSFEQALRPYRADYFVWDALLNPDWKLNEQVWLEPVFRHKQFIIYASKPQLAADTFD